VKVAGYTKRNGWGTPFANDFYLMDDHSLTVVKAHAWRSADKKTADRMVELVRDLCRRLGDDGYCREPFVREAS
jgi:hypothetical protein